jgi:hypothetical protein
MSALAMILMAAMAVPGDGSEQVSAETIEKRLDLRGRWELELVGYFQGACYSEEQLCRILHVQDDGGGVLRLSMPKFGEHGLVFIPCSGTYHQVGDLVVINFRVVAEKTPDSFRDNIPKGCLILHRVKSRK